MCEACQFVEVELAAQTEQPIREQSGLEVVRVSPLVRVERVSDVEA